MYSFPKSRRLLAKSDYNKVFSTAFKCVIPGFVVLYTPNVLGYSRLGMALTKKIIPKAHDRNKIKRHLRETFRLNDLPAIDIVVLARKSILTMKNHEIINELGGLWKKLKRSVKQ